MVAKCSSPFSQNLATGFHPEQANPVHTFTQLSKIHFNIILHIYLLNATVEWLQLMLCTREVPDSYLDPKVCYHA